MAQVITHRMPLSEAARGYKIFNDKKEENGQLVEKVRKLCIRLSVAQGMTGFVKCHW